MSGEDPCSCDEELASARAGSQQAFATLVRAHQKSVFGVALRMLASREQAEELAQEVFLSLHRNLAAIESARHLSFWLRRVTANAAIDRLRRPRLVTTPLHEAADLAQIADESDPLLRRELSRLLSGLQPAPRAVLILRYQEDLDPVEIARVLDLPVNTVKSHLKRSLASLRERMREPQPARQAPMSVATRDESD